MTGKRFKIYQDMYETLYIEDKETGVGICVGNEEDVRYNTVSEIVQLLNELHEEKNELRLQLNLCSDQRNEFHRGARENANRVGKLEKENEQLKQTIQRLEQNIDELLSVNVEEQLLKENEQLKQQIADWETSYHLLKATKEWK